MENVGESKLRNEDFNKSFSRSTLIKGLVADLDSATIFDVGGHKGQSIKFFRGLFPSAVIHSFEPGLQSFQALSVFEGEKTHCYNIAISDHDGEAEFFQNEISHTNSLYKVNLKSKDSIFFNSVKGNKKDSDVGKFNNTTNVVVRRLDSFCEEKAIHKIDLLKIDVQGAEGKVLVGAGNLLDVVDYLVLEVSFFDYYVHKSSFFEIEEILIPFGFRLFCISEISNNPMNGRTDWAEVIYKKQGKV
jgi:FkbM family methyltransferase